MKKRERESGRGRRKVWDKIRQPLNEIKVLIILKNKENYKLQYKIRITTLVLSNNNYCDMTIIPALGCWPPLLLSLVACAQSLSQQWPLLEMFYKHLLQEHNQYSLDLSNE